MFDYSFLYLLSPLHTGGTTQEGNLVGIARESHTNFPYIPSSSIRGRLRASIEEQNTRDSLFGTDLETSAQLEQGSIWIGDGSILWIPIPSLSHGVVWISSPMLLKRWAKFKPELLSTIPSEYSCSFHSANSAVYLKDAILQASDLSQWQNWQEFIPEDRQKTSIDRVLVLPDRHCATLIQMSLWRQVKIKLDSSKTVDGGFRYEEAIPPDTLMYFPWGINSAAKDSEGSKDSFLQILSDRKILQIGGQESLGRGFVEQWQATQQVEQTA